jgi:hypothetical protein
MINRIDGSNVELKIGDAVILRPRPGGDVMDIVLGGRRAVISSFEEDFEGRIHVAVIIDDDPGRDLGQMALPGHRFFYAPDELEPCSPAF